MTASTKTSTRRGIRTKALPKAKEGDLVALDQVQTESEQQATAQRSTRKGQGQSEADNGADGEHGEHRGTFLLCKNSSDLSGAETTTGPPFPEEKLSNHVHDVHHVHPSAAGAADDDPLGAVTDPGAEDIAAAVALIEDAAARCKDDPALLASEAFNDAARLVRAQNPGEWFRLRVALKKGKPDGVLLEDIDRATRPGGDAEEDPTTADELVALVRERAELWHAEDGTCYATLNESPRKTLRLDTKAFIEWLGYAYYQSTATDKSPGRAAGDVAIRTARMVLTGIATNEGQERAAYLRTARQADTYYLDLGSDDWSAVEISAQGWRVIDAPPVRFWRSSTTRPLPMPVSGGDLSALWDFANIPEAARPLVEAVMLESWRPETPFPLLELIGQHGSAKSSTQSRLRACIDPNAINLRAAPKSVEDLYVSAGVNWCCSLNNLSHLSANLQDALCNLATGGGFAGRTLYTNADETVIEAKRPVMLNGIVPLVTAQDLTDRVVHIELPRIDTYRSETELETDFEKAWPGIFGALLDRFSATLAVLSHVKLERPPRMADFAKLGEAMLQAQGKTPGAFVSIYEANRRDSVARNLEASPVAMAIRALSEAKHNGSALIFEGTMKELLDRLSNYREQQEAWPKSPRGLGDALRRQRPALAQIGIDIEITKPGKHGVTVYIRRGGEHGEHGERSLKVFLSEKAGAPHQYADAEEF